MTSHENKEYPEFQTGIFGRMESAHTTMEKVNKGHLQ